MRRCIRELHLVTTVLALLMAVNAAAQPSTCDVSSVWRADSAWAHAVAAQDQVALLSSYDPGARLDVPGTASVVGHSAIAAFWGGFSRHTASNGLPTQLLSRRVASSPTPLGRTSGRVPSDQTQRPSSAASISRFGTNALMALGGSSRTSGTRANDRAA
ncbi:MAG: hypothetical protein ACT4P6_13575 [Gemmatimonadaceae bacterium]